MSLWHINSRPNDLEELKSSILKLRGLEINEIEVEENLVSLISRFPKKLIDNLALAKKLILEAVSENKLIVIHGDYDADGVCATSILYLTILEYLKYPNITYVIPDRFEDGYGLSDKTVEKILEKSFNQNFLLITVDSGITSVKQVAELKKLGNKVIITDHHHQGSELPDADAIIWDDTIVGSTLSWFLALGLGGVNPHFMCLAGIATVTDVFPLKGFNRKLVKKSIKILRENPPLFISQLYLELGKNYRKIDVFDLGFVIGPRLNSSGRLAHANTSVSLILSTEISELQDLLKEINLLNHNRQELTQKAVDSLDTGISNSKVIIHYDETLHEGILGLIASKICQIYYKPSLVISKNGELLKGSARSIKGINIVEVLETASGHLQSFGGHSQAAGFSLLESNLGYFSKTISDFVETQFCDDVFEKIIIADAEIDEKLLNIDLAEFVTKLEPFGQGNEEPIFLISNLKILEIKKIGSSSQHLNLKLLKNNSEFKGVVFNFDSIYNNLSLGDEIDILFKLRLNNFNNRVSLDLFIVEFRKSNDENK